MKKKIERGSIELIVLGLIAALIVVLAIPALTGLGRTVNSTLSYANSQLNAAIPASN